MNVGQYVKSFVRELLFLISKSRVLNLLPFKSIFNGLSSSHDNFVAALSSEQELIHKNTTVNVARSPLENGKKKVWEEEVLSAAGTALPLSMQASSGSLNVSSMLPAGSSGGAATESDRLENMMANSTEMYKGME